MNENHEGQGDNEADAVKQTFRDLDHGLEDGFDDVGDCLFGNQAKEQG